MAGQNPGSPTDFQYFYEDEVYKINNSGQVVFGLVLENYEANSSDQESDMETPIQKGEIRVVWHPSGTERVISEKSVGLADRSLMPGDVVRRLIAGKDTQRGYCRDIVMTAALQIVGTKHVIPNVASERLQPLEEFTPDLAVCLDSWVGTSKAVHSKLRLVSADGSRLEYPDLDTCPLEDYSMRRRRSTPYSSSEFYPGQVLYGPLGSLDTGANWLHVSKEMKAARKHKMHDHKFTVEAVVTESVSVHWQCRALCMMPPEAPAPQQPKFIVEGEDLKRLKLLNVFEPCTLQVGDRNFLTIGLDDTFVSKKQWRKQQSKCYRHLRKQTRSSPKKSKGDANTGDHVPSRPKKRASSHRKIKSTENDMEVDLLEDKLVSLDDTLKADTNCPSIKIEPIGDVSLPIASSLEDTVTEEKNDSGISPEPAKEDSGLLNEDGRNSVAGLNDDDSENWENTSSDGSDTDSGATWSSRCSSAASGSGRGKRSPQLAVRLLRGKRLKRAPRRAPPAPPPRRNERVVVETLHTTSHANVVWQDGTIEMGIPSTQLYPIHHLDGQECFPGDFVVSGAANVEENQQLKHREYGVVQRVDHHGRTAIVHWYRTYTSSDEPVPQMLFESEVSVYDLKDHPDFQYRPGTVVIRIANFTGEDVNCTAGQVIDNFTSGRVKVWWVDGHTSMCWPQDLFKVGEYDSEDGELWASDASGSEDSWETQSSLPDPEPRTPDVFPCPPAVPVVPVDSTENSDPADCVASVDRSLAADPVASADRATAADHVASADRATLADRAASADRATPADRAASADRATPADHAASADRATPTDRAVSADRATPVSRAASADRATPADRTTYAGCANPVDRATLADRATPVDRPASPLVHTAGRGNGARSPQLEVTEPSVNPTEPVHDALSSAIEDAVGGCKCEVAGAPEVAGVSVVLPAGAVPRLLEPRVAAHIERGRLAMRRLEDIFSKHPTLQSQEVMRKLLNLYKDCRFLDRLMSTAFFHEDIFLGLIERVKERGATTPRAGERRVHEQLARLFAAEDEMTKPDGFTVGTEQEISAEGLPVGRFIVSNVAYDTTKLHNAEPMEVEGTTTKKPLHLNIEPLKSLASDENALPEHSDFDPYAHNVCQRLCALIHSQLIKAHAEVNRRRPLELAAFLNGLMKKQSETDEKLPYHFTVQYGALVVTVGNADEKEDKAITTDVHDAISAVVAAAEASVPVSNETAPLATAENADVESEPPAPPVESVVAGEGFIMLESPPAAHRFRLSILQPSEPRSFYTAIKREIKLLKSDLPSGVWVRGYEERIDLLSVMIAGPARTPYEGGLFVFDVQLGGEYPRAPPLCHYQSYCSDRLNPNLYEDGKVCVSLLGTWSGRGVEVWGKDSSLLQVIVSLQGLILNAEPYFNEAGYEKQKGTQQGKENSRMYNEMVLLKLVQSMTKMLSSPPEPFREEILQHMRTNAAALCLRLEGLVALSNEVTPLGLSPPDYPLIPASRGFCLTLRSSLDAFRATLRRNDIHVPASAL